MSKNQLPIITFKGRNLGIAILFVSQLIIGTIHSFFGLLLLANENLSFLPTTAVYDVYTFVFGLFALVFAVLIWQRKKAGWIGTVAISLFVIIADSLTLLNLPSIPGIPKFAGFTEITYSILIVSYLLQTKIKRIYFVPKKN
jgi:hypothetical protein